MESSHNCGAVSNCIALIGITEEGRTAWGQQEMPKDDSSGGMS